MVVSDDLRSEYCDESATLDSLRINFFIISSVFSLNFSASEKIDIKNKQWKKLEERYMRREKERAIIGLQEGGRELGASGGGYVYIYIRGSTVRISTTV